MTVQARPRRGFTLIEMIIAVSILGIVAALGISSIRSANSASSQQGQVQAAKDDLLGVRDSAVATLQCRRVEQQTGGAGNRGLRVFHDVACTPGATGDDVLLNTVQYDPALVTRVKVVDNGIYDDEMIQYRTDGSVFDTETTRVEVTTVDGVTHRLDIQLATGGVILH